MIKDVILKYLKNKYGFDGKIVGYEEGACRIQRFDNYSFVDVTWNIEYRECEIALTTISVKF